MCILSIPEVPGLSRELQYSRIRSGPSPSSLSMCVPTSSLLSLGVSVRAVPMEVTGAQGVAGLLLWSGCSFWEEAATEVPLGPTWFLQTTLEVSGWTACRRGGWQPSGVRIKWTRGWLAKTCLSSWHPAGKNRRGRRPGCLAGGGEGCEVNR